MHACSFFALCPPATRRTSDMVGDARKMDSLPDNLFDGIFDKGVARTRVWLEMEIASRPPSCLNAFESDACVQCGTPPAIP